MRCECKYFRSHLLPWDLYNFLRSFLHAGLNFWAAGNPRRTQGSFWGLAILRLNFLGPVLGPGGPFGRADMYLRSFGDVSV